MLFKIRLDLDPALEFSFVELPPGSRATLKQSFMPQVFKLIDTQDQFFSANVISSAVDSQGNSLDTKHANYHALLYTLKATGNKRGILIAHDGEGNAMIVAAWPTSFRDTCITDPKVLTGDLINLAVHPGRFMNVNLLGVTG
ncbi:hypothetical protein GF325_15180 [Candidatus Bathyarchaeota archaeon]|nr:hypothetical protein [Candidatus Bathyarchaeota archaeon]